MSGGDMKEALESVSTLVKSFINSRKQPVSVADVVADYIEVEGTPLPFRNFGYNTPEELLDATGDFLLTNYGRDSTITIAPGSSKSQHIVKFVRNQKPSKSRHISTPSSARRPVSYNKSGNSRPFKKRGAPKSFPNMGDRNNNNNSSSNIGLRKFPSQGTDNATSYNNSKFEAQDHIKAYEFRPPLQVKQQLQQKVQPKFPKLETKDDYQQNGGKQQYNDQNMKYQMMDGNKQNQEHSPKENFNDQAKRVPIKPFKSATSSLQYRLNVIKAAELDKNHIEESINANKQKLEDYNAALEERRQEVQVERSMMMEKPVNDSYESQMEFQKQLNLNQQLQYQKNIQHQQNLQQKQRQIQETNLKRQDYHYLKTHSQHHDMHKPKAYIEDHLKLNTDDSIQQKPKMSIQDRLKLKQNENNFYDGQTSRDLNERNSAVDEDRENYNGNSFEAQELEDPIGQLEDLCNQLKYPPPEFKMLQSKFVKNMIGTVSVDGKIFSTYPQEFEVEDEACRAVALVALEKVKHEIHKMNLPPCSLEVKDFIDRLHQEVSKHPTGVFAKDMVDRYESTVQERIHENWWTLVQVSSYFKTEEICDNIIIFATDNKKKEETPTSPVQTDLVYVAPIELPWHEDCWRLNITYCNRTTEVWARLDGAEYSYKYDELLQEIADHMTTDKSKWKRAPVIKPQLLYLFYTHDSWHRVRVESIDKEKNEAICFYIDFGDYGAIEVDNLYMCDRRFLELPAQAVPFILYGLEDFADHPKGQKVLLNELLLKTVDAKVFTKEDDYFSIDPEIGGKIKIIMYDTSLPDNQNLNDQLLQTLVSCVKPPELKLSNINHVQVSHINDRGEVYIRIRNDNLKYLENFLQRVGTLKNLDHHRVKLDDMRNSTKFLFCDNSNKNLSKWYRGSLNTNSRIMPNTVFFELFCIDVGKMCSVHMSKIYRLSSLSAALASFPNQAIKVRLFNILDLKPAMVGRLRALLPLNSDALVKVGKVKLLPLVTFYIRQGNGTLVNINENLSMEQELDGWKDIYVPNSGNDDDNASVSSDGSAIRRSQDIVLGIIAPSLDSLKDLPKIKQITELPFFDRICLQIRVTLVASPWNFSVQLYERYNQLRLLMKDLQIYCNNHEELIPHDMVEVGQAYATKHEDGYFHRVRVTRIYVNKNIQVTFIDIGDVNTVRSEQLKFLPLQFRALPEMAMQAKLRSIQPLEEIWGPEGCLKFRELTIGRAFIGIVTVMQKLPEEGERVLLMDELIDVANPHDLYIGEMLVQHNYASKTAI